MAVTIYRLHEANNAGPDHTTCLNESRYCTIKELAKGTETTSTLYAWAAQGRIPCIKIHGLVRFRVMTLTAG